MAVTDNINSKKACWSEEVIRLCVDEIAHLKDIADQIQVGTQTTRICVDHHGMR